MLNIASCFIFESINSNSSNLMSLSLVRNAILTLLTLSLYILNRFAFEFLTLFIIWIDFWTLQKLRMFIYHSIAVLQSETATAMWFITWLNDNFCIYNLWATVSVNVRYWYWCFDWSLAWFTLALNIAFWQIRTIWFVCREFKYKWLLDFIYSISGIQIDCRLQSDEVNAYYELWDDFCLRISLADSFSLHLVHSRSEECYIYSSLHISDWIKQPTFLTDWVKITQFAINKCWDLWEVHDNFLLLFRHWSLSFQIFTHLTTCSLGARHNKHAFREETCSGRVTSSLLDWLSLPSWGCSLCPHTVHTCMLCELIVD